MTPCIVRRLPGAIFVTLLVAGAASAQVGSSHAPRAEAGTPASPARPPWWKDEQFRKDLGLTAEQSAKVDAIFQAVLPSLRQGYDELVKREAKLSRLIEANAEEAVVLGQIEKVEETRSALNKTRTLMHLHMRQTLTPDQRQRFTALYEQRRQRDQLQKQQPPQNRQDH